jgi:hypothetical protein
MGPITEKYVVLSETGILLEGNDETVHAKGTVLDLNPENEQVKALLENESIAPVQVMSDDQLEDFVVTEEFLSENPAIAATGVVVGDTIRLPKDALVTEDETVEGDAPEVAAEEEAEAAGEEATEEEVAPAVPFEGRLIAGKQIISATTRIVNDREYIHVRDEAGSEFDLSEEEFNALEEA